MSSHAQRRPALWLLLLLVSNVLLLSIQVRDARGRVLLRGWALLLSSPFVKGVDSAVGGVRGLLDRYVFLLHAEQESQRLRLENAQLRIENYRLRSLASLAERMANYEELKSRYEFSSQVASVIGLSAPFYARRLVIDAGTLRDVGRDAAVFNPAGVVGRVAAVSPWTAEVELIVNEGAGAGALLEGTRLQGVVRGDGTGLLKLEYIPNVETVEVGALVITSGTDQVYPKGLTIGTVQKSEKTSMIYREIEVKPAVDFSRLDEVMVVLPTPKPTPPGGGAADEGSH